MKVLSVKLTPSLECHRTAWRHGGASFMKPVPALLQMSHGEFFTASQSLGRQSRKPYYIWGQAPLKLTATAATAKLAEREGERGMFTISTWQQGKLHTSCSHLLWLVERQKEQWTSLLKLNESSELCQQRRFRITPSLLLSCKWRFVAWTQTKSKSINHVLFPKTLALLQKLKLATFPDVPPYSDQLAPHCKSQQLKITYSFYSPLQMATPAIMILSR